MSEHSQQVHAVLLSGAGAQAAYEVGVLKALLYEECGTVSGPVNPAIYSGISMGALNAAVMAARADRSSQAAVDYLERLWLERIAEGPGDDGNGVFRFRLNPFRYLNPLAWLTLNPLKPMVEAGSDAVLLARETLRRTAQFFLAGESLEERVLKLADLSTGVDFAPLQALVRDAIDASALPDAKTQLRITAANWEKGKPETFANADLEDERGYEAIVAASTIPGVAPAQLIDESLFVGSSVLFGTPLTPAIQAAFDAHPQADENPRPKIVLHVVYLDPEIADVRLPPVPNTLSSSIRLYSIAFSRSVNADIAVAKAINKRLRFRDGFREALDEGQTAEGKKSKALQVLDHMAKDLRHKAMLTIHRYRPSKVSKRLSGLLQFDSDRIESLIAAGYDDARRHDCGRSECELRD